MSSRDNRTDEHMNSEAKAGTKGLHRSKLNELPALKREIGHEILFIIMKLSPTDNCLQKRN